MTVKRRAARVAGIAVLALTALTAPARADGSYECFSGERSPAGDAYSLTGWDCVGAGYAQVKVTLRLGPVAGTYVCGYVFSWNGTLSGNVCRL
ncbi:hypothetical protein ACU635_40915 [[Actinomadura] parvosata]|uniref:hypothetical protein n=1 Tax=[Actinomadura] parvosata TaxID=1955412 RepID=UPI00406CDA36